MFLENGKTVKESGLGGDCLTLADATAVHRFFCRQPTRPTGLKMLALVMNLTTFYVFPTLFDTLSEDTRATVLV